MVITENASEKKEKLDIITFSVDEYSIKEYNSLNYLPVSLTRTGDGSNSIKATLYTINDTAKSWSDYEKISSNDPIELSLAAGETQKTVYVLIYIFNDNLVEGNEHFYLKIANPGVGEITIFPPPNSAKVTIIDDEVAAANVTLTARRDSVTENGSDLWFDFKRTGDLTEALTVNFDVDGTAIFNSDYTAKNATSYNTSSGTITFAAGKDKVSLKLDTIDDTIAEGNETITLTLASSKNYTIGTTDGISGTILNEDGGSSNDILTGGTGKDVLDGLGGDDTLIGGAKGDTLTGGSGKDQFTYRNKNEGNDSILDFNVADDTIAISKGFAKGLTPGILAQSQFVIGAAATTAAHRLIYNDVSGQLSFDRDGNGALSPTNLAILSSGLAMTNQDILVIA